MDFPLTLCFQRFELALGFPLRLFRFSEFCFERLNLLCLNFDLLRGKSLRGPLAPHLVSLKELDQVKGVLQYFGAYLVGVVLKRETLL